MLNYLAMTGFKQAVGSHFDGLPTLRFALPGARLRASLTEISSSLAEFWSQQLFLTGSEEGCDRAIPLAFHRI